jgi:hypothetical protein
MWEGIDGDQETKEDATWIANGMRHNSLIWVTDGSHNKKKASDLSGVGWIIFCTRTGLRLVGTFWEKPTWANLYRAEMLDLCALHLLAQVVAEFYKVEKWSAILCCDNKCALELPTTEDASDPAPSAQIYDATYVPSNKPLLETSNTFTYMATWINISNGNNSP